MILWLNQRACQEAQVTARVLKQLPGHLQDVGKVLFMRKKKYQMATDIQRLKLRENINAAMAHKWQLRGNAGENDLIQCLQRPME